MALADKIFDSNEAVLRDSLVQIEREVQRLIGQLKTNSIGNIKNTQANIIRARQMRREVLKLMNKEFGPAATKAVASMEQVPAHVKSVFKKSGVVVGFSEADEVMLRSFMTATEGDLNAAGASWAGDVSNTIYSGAIANTPYAEVEESVKQLLLGKTDARGSPMLHHVTTITNTRFAEVDTTLMFIKGEEIGVTEWRYFGTSMKDSRSWCINHMGKVFTKEKIKEWQGRSWAGKKPGDPFIVRGGWNCRHSWSPVIDEPKEIEEDEKTPTASSLTQLNVVGEQFDKDKVDLRRKLGRNPTKDEIASLQKAASANMQRLVDESHTYIAVEGDILEKILEEGRFKSQFETQTSRGFLDNKVRANAENLMLGVPKDISPSKRPIYGYLTDAAKGENVTTDFYGRTKVQLKASTRERTTATFGDSLIMIDSDIYANAFAMPLKSVGREAGLRAMHLQDINKLQDFSGYVEAQIHGGVSIGDIEKIFYSKRQGPPSQKLNDLLIKHDIKWELL